MAANDEVIVVLAESLSHTTALYRVLTQWMMRINEILCARKQDAQETYSVKFSPYGNPC